MANEMTAAALIAPPAPTPEPKKRVRATIADHVAIARHIQNHGEVRYNDDDTHEIWSYERGYSDERIAREYAPHLAAHHVTAVREAIYPHWEKRPAEMAVEDRLTAIEEQLEHYFKRRLDAIDREVNGPKIEKRLAALEDRFNTVDQRIIKIEANR